MNQIKKEDIDEENIVEVLEKVGIEFEEAEVVPNEISLCPVYDGPADFVVKLDGIYQTVEILNRPLDDDVGFKLFRHYAALEVHRDFGDDVGSWIILSLCEDSKELWKTFGCVTAKFSIISLKGITLD